MHVSGEALNAKDVPGLPDVGGDGEVTGDLAIMGVDPRKARSTVRPVDSTVPSTSKVMSEGAGPSAAAPRPPRSSVAAASRLPPGTSSTTDSGSERWEDAPGRRNRGKSTVGCAPVSDSVYKRNAGEYLREPGYRRTGKQSGLCMFAQKGVILTSVN